MLTSLVPICTDIGSIGQSFAKLILLVTQFVAIVQAARMQHPSASVTETVSLSS